MNSRSALLLIMFLVLGIHSYSNAQDQRAIEAVTAKPDVLESRELFEVNGREAFVMWPAQENRSTPQPWVMYSPTLKGIPDVHEKWMHQQFVDAGVAVAGINIGEAYGSPDGRRLFSALYNELARKKGFAAKPVLLGRSRGGLWSSSWAIHNGDKVAGLAGIYPVFDLTTYPGVKRAASAYKMTEAELNESLDKNNPIERIGALAKAKIPVFIIHGDVDKVVPLKENSQRLVETYESLGAKELVELEVVEGQGHNYFKGFFTSQKLVDFTIKHAKEGAKAKLPPRKLQQLPAGVEVIRDNVYSTVGGRQMLLDLYRPKEIAGKLPVVIWVHGGGWKNGSKDRCPAAWLAANGFAVASINYRLTDQAKWPAQIDDCRASVRWLRQNADKYQLDSQHIGAWGSSAGGHLVALMGTLDAPSDEKVSSRVQAACDWFGPSDLLTMPANTLGNGRTESDISKSNGAKLLGGTVRDLPELARQASAIYQVSKDDPPFLIMHGEQDPGVPLSQSQLLHEKLQSTGVASKLNIVKGAGHGGKEFQTREVKQTVLDFFNQTLK